MISLGGSSSEHLSDLKKSHFSSGLLDYKVQALPPAITYLRIKRKKEKKEKTQKLRNIAQNLNFANNEGTDKM